MSIPTRYSRTDGAPPPAVLYRSRSRSRSRSRDDCSEDSVAPAPAPPGLVRITQTDLNHLAQLIYQQQEAKRRFDEADAELRGFMLGMAWEVRRAYGWLPQ